MRDMPFGYQVPWLRLRLGGWVGVSCSQIWLVHALCLFQVDPPTGVPKTLHSWWSRASLTAETASFRQGLPLPATCISCCATACACAPLIRVSTASATPHPPRPTHLYSTHHMAARHLEQLNSTSNWFPNAEVAPAAPELAILYFTHFVHVGSSTQGKQACHLCS